MRQPIAPILLLFASAACGEVNNFSDAAVSDDVQIDADTTPDAVATGPVTITATHACCTSSGVAAGVDVIVVGPDGTAGEAVQTGADGTATVTVTAGDSITTILHEGTNHYLSTHLAVEPGDHLQVGGDYQVPGTARGTMTMTWTGFAGATQYYVFGPCGASYASDANAYSYAFRDTCSTGTFDVAVLGYGANGLAGWKILPDQTFVASGQLPLGALQSSGTFAVSMSGLPPEVTYASASATGRLTGSVVELYGGSAGGAPAAGVVTGSFPWATAGAGTVVEGFYQRDNFQGQSSREVLPTTATAYNRASVELLPWLSGGLTVNLAARAVTWIQSGDQPYDGAAVKVRFARTPVVGGVTDDYHWLLVVPPGISNLTFPELPAAYAAHDLVDTDTGYGGVILVDRSDADGFDGLRAVPAWELVINPYGDGAALDDPPVRWSGYNNY